MLGNSPIVCGNMLPYNNLVIESTNTAVDPSQGFGLMGFYNVPLAIKGFIPFTCNSPNCVQEPILLSSFRVVVMHFNDGSDI